MLLNETDFIKMVNFSIYVNESSRIYTKDEYEVERDGGLDMHAFQMTTPPWVSHPLRVRIVHQLPADSSICVRSSRTIFQKPRLSDKNLASAPLF